MLKAPAAAEADKRWDYKKMYARRVVVQCPVLAVALYVAVAQFYDVEARLALARSLDLGWAFLAWYVVYLARQSVAINAAACRAGARCPRPDQHVYRIAHPDFNEKPYVMMCQRRPARALQPRPAATVFNYDEALLSLGPSPERAARPRRILAVLNCVEIKFYGAFVLNRRVPPAADTTPARRRGDAGSSPLDGPTAASSPRNDLVKNCRCIRHGAISRAERVRPPSVRARLRT